MGRTHHDLQQEECLCHLDPHANEGGHGQKCLSFITRQRHRAKLIALEKQTTLLNVLAGHTSVGVVWGSQSLV